MRPAISTEILPAAYRYKYAVRTVIRAFLARAICVRATEPRRQRCAFRRSIFLSSRARAVRLCGHSDLRLRRSRHRVFLQLPNEGLLAHGASVPFAQMIRAFDFDSVLPLVLYPKSKCDFSDGSSQNQQRRQQTQLGSHKAEVSASFINSCVSEFPNQFSMIQCSALILLEAGAHEFIPNRISGWLA